MVGRPRNVTERALHAGHVWPEESESERVDKHHPQEVRVMTNLGNDGSFVLTLGHVHRDFASLKCNGGTAVLRHIKCMLVYSNAAARQHQ